nr:hypothetical protein [Tanacetum cinerariifolium]
EAAGVNGERVSNQQVTKDAIKSRLSTSGLVTQRRHDAIWVVVDRLIELVRGYKYHPLHVISYPLDQIRTDLTYVEEPEAILDRQDRVMRKKTIPFVKILWRNHPERVATWETEESIWTSYPHFLPRSVVKMGIDGECGYEGVVVK